MKLILILVLMVNTAVHAFKIHPMDSVGIEIVGKRTYILHKVENNETLYSISRRYDVSINQIIKNNPSIGFNLEVGLIVRVPHKVKRSELKAIEVGVKNETSKDKVHIVEPKETLYSISRKYGVKVADIIDWNSIVDSKISIGQQLTIKSDAPANLIDKDTGISRTPGIGRKEGENKILHIVEPSQTLYSLSKTYNVGIDDLKKWNHLISNDISIGQELIVGMNDGDDSRKPLDADQEIDRTISPEEDKPGNKAMEHKETTLNFDEVVEGGLAAVIDGSENTRKYLALHRSAKVGTILKVHNEMNDQEVFVRVIGQLPDIGVNDNVIIKISKSAYDGLGAIDPRFRVKVSYFP